MNISIEDEEVKEYYSDLACAAEAIFVHPSDFKMYFLDNEKIINERLPNSLLAGEAILTNYSQLLKYAKIGGVHMQRYKLTLAEGGYWTAIISWRTKPPKGDIMSLGRRLPGSYYSKK